MANKIFIGDSHITKIDTNTKKYRRIFHPNIFTTQLKHFFYGFFLNNNKKYVVVLKPWKIRNKGKEEKDEEEILDEHKRIPMAELICRA